MEILWKDKCVNCCFPRNFHTSKLSEITVCYEILTRRGVVAITTAQLYSTKPEFRLCTGSNPARGASEIRDGLEIMLNAFRRSSIPQK